MKALRMRKMLKIKGLRKSFGGLTALGNLSMSIEKGISGIIGPNGSGKTTLFNVLTGYLRPDEGEIYYRDKRISGLAPHRIANLGITRTFQLVRVFPRMTVMENMLLAPKKQKGEAIWWAWLYQASWEKDLVKKAEELLGFVGLLDKKNNYASDLSFGQQRLLELARALMSGPELLLLDEPTGGLNPVLVNRLGGYIRKLGDEGLSFLIIEHNMGFVNELCEKVFVLDHGKMIAQGRPRDIRNDKKVLSAYIGGTVNAQDE